MRLLLGTIMAVGAALTACATPAVSSAPTVPPVATTTTATASSTTAEPPPPPPPCAPTVRACVSLSLKQAWLLTSGVIDYGPVSISHGAPDSPTPTGTFPVSWKDADNTSSSIYGTPMPNSVFFAPGGIAFHEGSITEPSHGGVRLTPDAAKVFFDHLTRGQLVQVVT